MASVILPSAQLDCRLPYVWLIRSTYNRWIVVASRFPSNNTRMIALPLSYRGTAVTDPVRTLILGLRKIPSSVRRIQSPTASSVSLNIRFQSTLDQATDGFSSGWLMTRADSVLSTPPRDTSATDLETFAALAAAAHPAWHQAVIRLAKSTDDLSAKMSLLLNEPGSVRDNAGKVVEMLIAYLDLIAGNFDLEEGDDDGESEDAELSLGSFDWMTDHSKGWGTSNVYWAFTGSDLEQDDCGAKDGDPNEDKQQPPEMGGEA